MHFGTVLPRTANMSVSLRWACATIRRSGRRFPKRATAGKRAPGIGDDSKNFGSTSACAAIAASSASEFHLGQDDARWVMPNYLRLLYSRLARPWQPWSPGSPVLRSGWLPLRSDYMRCRQLRRPLSLSCTGCWSRATLSGSCATVLMSADSRRCSREALSAFPWASSFCDGSRRRPFGPQSVCCSLYLACTIFCVLRCRVQRMPGEWRMPAPGSSMGWLADQPALRELSS